MQLFQRSVNLTLVVLHPLTSGRRRRTALTVASLPRSLSPNPNAEYRRFMQNSREGLPHRHNGNRQARPAQAPTLVGPLRSPLTLAELGSGRSALDLPRPQTRPSFGGPGETDRQAGMGLDGLGARSIFRVGDPTRSSLQTLPVKEDACGWDGVHAGRRATANRASRCPAELYAGAARPSTLRAYSLTLVSLIPNVSTTSGTQDSTAGAAEKQRRKIIPRNAEWALVSRSGGSQPSNVLVYAVLSKGADRRENCNV